MSIMVFLTNTLFLMATGLRTLFIFQQSITLLSFELLDHIQFKFFYPLIQVSSLATCHPSFSYLQERGKFRYIFLNFSYLEGTYTTGGYYVGLMKMIQCPFQKIKPLKISLSIIPLVHPFLSCPMQYGARRERERETERSHSATKKRADQRIYY